MHVYPIYKFLFIQFNSFFYIDVWHFQTFNSTLFASQLFSDKNIIYVRVILLYDLSVLHFINFIVRDLFITTQSRASFIGIIIHASYLWWNSSITGRDNARIKREQCVA